MRIQSNQEKNLPDLDMVMKIYQNLSFLNIFGWDVFCKQEPSSPFLSAIYMLKSGFSVEYGFDRCVEI